MSCDEWKIRASTGDLPPRDYFVNIKVAQQSVSQWCFPGYCRLWRSSVTAAAKFGDRVRAIRKAQKLKIALVAERVGKEVKHLGRIERGEKKPSFELIIALAEAMKVSPATFFEFDPPQTDPRVLRKQLDQLLANREPGQLQQVQRLLRVFFNL